MGHASLTCIAFAFLAWMAALCTDVYWMTTGRNCIGDEKPVSLYETVAVRWCTLIILWTVYNVADAMRHCGCISLRTAAKLLRLCFASLAAIAGALWWVALSGDVNTLSTHTCVSEAFWPIYTLTAAVSVVGGIAGASACTVEGFEEWRQCTR